MILSVGVIAILILGLVWGFHTGFVLQLITLLVYAFSGLIAIGLSTPTASFLYGLYRAVQPATTTIPRLWIVIAFGVIFIIASLLLWRLGRILNLITKLPVIHFLNGVLGAFVGLVVRYLLVFIILNILILIPSTWIQQQYHASSLSQTIVTQTPVISNQLFNWWQTSRHTTP